MPQAQGVVDIFVSGKPSEHRLPQQPDQRVTAIPAGACIAEQITRHRAQPESVVELAVGENLASEVIPGAMDPSFSRRSKSSLREPSIDLPVGCAMTAPCGPD